MQAIKGRVTGVDGLQVSIAVNDDTETKIGIERGHTKITLFENDEARKKRDGGKDVKQAEIKTGDHVEASGSDLHRCDAIVVTRGTAKDVAEVQDFNAKKLPAPAAAPAPAIKTVDPVRSAATVEVPADVPHGQRRAYREAELKKQEKAEKKETAAKK